MPRTLFSLTADGAEMHVVIDCTEMIDALAGIRTLEPGELWFGINSMAVNPSAVAAGESSLFLGDYWSGLQMVRMDLSPRSIIDELTALIQALPASVFTSTGAGQRHAITGILAEVEALAAGDNTMEAVRKLENLRKRIDGCGIKADRDDWIKDCDAQRSMREFIDDIIAGL